MSGREVDQMMSIHNSHVEEIRQCLSMSIEVAVCLQELKQSDKADELDAVMKELISCEDVFKIQMDALRNLKQSFGTGDFSAKSFLEKEVTKLRENKPKNEFESHEKYKEYRKKSYEAKNPGKYYEEEDAELVVTQQKQNFTCPITRQIIENPYKNKLCGHSYGYDAIKQMIGTEAKKRKQLTCPVPGCSQKVTLDTLVKDNELEQALRKYKPSDESDDEEEEEVLDLQEDDDD